MYPSGLDKSPWFSNKGKSPFAVSANPDEITERWEADPESIANNKISADNPNTQC